MSGSWILSAVGLTIAMSAAAIVLSIHARRIQSKPLCSHPYEGCCMENATFVNDGHGGSWQRCGPDCHLEVVGPGKVQCDCQ